MQLTRLKNDDDQKKAVSTINTLLDKADFQYRLLQERKAALETLLVCVSDHSSDKPYDTGPAPATTQTGTSTAGSGTASSASSSSAINKNIQSLHRSTAGTVGMPSKNSAELFRKCLHLVKSWWNTTDSSRRQLSLQPFRCPVLIHQCPHSVLEPRRYSSMSLSQNKRFLRLAKNVHVVSVAQVPRSNTVLHF